MRTSKLLTLLVCTLLLNGCGKAAYNFTSSAQEATSGDNFVCDPNEAPPSAEHGVIGSLNYLTPAQVQTGLGAKLADYFDHGIHIASPIYMSKLDIPTQVFTRGFITITGEPLKTIDGDILTEWFALKYKMQIKLTDSEATGRYQFALLADDGVTLTTPSRTLISNDTITATSFNYAQTFVTMNRQTKLPIEIQYFQGPRMHISLILMWRPWTGDPSDPAGGVAGNELYFDSTTIPSTPKQAYLDLLARGWKPLNPENFLLPEGQVNPCY